MEIMKQIFVNICTKIKIFLKNFKKQVKSIPARKKLWLLGTFLCFFAIILSFKWGITIRHGDSTFPQNPHLSLYKVIYTWDDMRRFGLDNSRALADIFPYKFLVYLISLFKIPVFLNQIILFSLIFILPFWTTYYLGNILFPKQRIGLISFFAGLLYVFNIFVFIKFSIPVFVIQLSYALLPLLIAFSVQYFKTGHNKYILLFLLTAFLNSSIGNNIAFFISMIIFILIFFIYYIFNKQIENKKLLLRGILLGIGFILISLWWLIPQMNAVKQQYNIISDSSFVKEYNETALRSTSFNGIVLNSLRLIGTWTWFHNDRFGSAFFPEHEIYDGILSIWGFTFVLLAFAALLFGRNRKIILFSFTLILGVFLMKGISEPFGWLFYFLYKHFPLFWIFRFTYDKFGPITSLSLAFLISYSLYNLIIIISNWRHKLTYIVLSAFTLFIIFYMFPFWDGNTFRDGHPVQTHINFPKAYFSAADYLNKENGDYRVLLLPFSLGNSIAKSFQWEYIGMDPFEFLTYKSVIYHLLELEGPQADMTKFIKNIIHGQKWEEFVKLAPLFNIKKIIVENDASIELFPFIEFGDDFKKFAEKNENISYEKSFDSRIDIYQINKNLPKIYIPDVIHYFYGEADQLTNLAYFLKDDYKNAFILRDYNENFDISKIADTFTFVIPRVFERENEKESINLNLPEIGSYELWHKQDDYQLYDIYIESTPRFHINISKPSQEVKVLNKTFSLKKISKNLEFSLNTEKYILLTLVIDGKILKTIKVEDLKNKKSIFAGSYPFQINKKSLIQIYGAPLYSAENLLTNYSFENNNWQIGELISLEDPSFEESVWRLVQDAQSGKPGEYFINADLNEDATDGDYSLELTAQNHNATMYQKIFNFSPDALYDIEFDYKLLTGSPPFINLIEGGINIYHTFKLPVSEENKWEHFETIIKPKKITNRLSLYLYSNAPEDISKQTITLYDNIHVKKLPLIAEYQGIIFDFKTNRIEKAGKIEIKEKEIKIDMNDKLTDITNEILDEPSFERGIWSDPEDSKRDFPGIPNITAKLVKEAFDGENALKLSTDKHMINIHQAFKNFNVNIKYLISFDTKYIQGAKPHVLIHQKGINVYAPNEILNFVKKGEWTNYKFLFTPHKLATGASMYLYAGDGREVLTEILYDNFKIYKINTLDSFILHKEKKSIKEAKKINVDFKKINPVKYKGKISGNIKNDFVFIFGESFHPLWKLKLKNINTNEIFYIKNSDHFVINGYANAWIIPAGNYEFYLEFQGQKIFLLSIMLCGISTLLFIFLIYHFKRKYHHYEEI
jgi:hypothetical protein